MKTSSVGARRVIVAMSGGVDSSVAAAFCLDLGWEVIGVTLQLQEALAMSGEAVAAAQAVCRHLGVPHQVLDLREAFREEVLRPAWEEYACGRTPNPCTRCNPRIKFGRLLALADTLGADGIVTGHHARVLHPATGPELRRGSDPAKDQSYFLFGLSLGQLARINFPVGEMTKPQVREEARRRGLPTAERKESQDACFTVPGETCADTLARLFAAASPVGVLRDPAGHELGRHGGVHHFTIGQRRGLGVALGQRAFVTGIDGRSGDIQLSLDPADLDCVRFSVAELNWLVPPATETIRCLVQIRYRQIPVPALVRLDGARGAEMILDRPERGVAPGQAAVCYDGDRVLGGGSIGARLEA